MLDLHEVEAIKRLKYKYLRCLDQKLWDEIRGCFTPDARCSYSGGKYAFDGPTTATAIWALEDEVIETKAQITIRGAAFYRDEYVKQGDAWWIRSTGYERTFEEIESRVDRPSLRLTASAWGPVGKTEP